MQRIYNKRGIENFKFEILQEVEDVSRLLFTEQQFLDKLKPVFNNSKIAGNTSGVKQSKETNKKNSERNSGFGNGNCKLKAELKDSIINDRPNMTVKQIAAKYSVHRSTIERFLKKYDSNNVGLRVYSNEGRNRLSELASKRRNRAVPVVQFDKEKNLIAKFPSATEASKYCGVSVAQIILCCKGVVRNPVKFYFKYAKQA